MALYTLEVNEEAEILGASIPPAVSLEQALKLIHSRLPKVKVETGDDGFAVATEAAASLAVQPALATAKHERLAHGFTHVVA